MTTYRVITKAVQSFTIPALRPGPSTGNRTSSSPPGTCPQETEAGHGRCGQILIHYRPIGGVREAVQGRASTEQLSKTDKIFEVLGTADGDAFANMTQIGSYVRDESRSIINSLLAREDTVARERIASTRTFLEPLQRELSDALKEMQQLEASLRGGRCPNWPVCHVRSC